MDNYTATEQAYKNGYEQGLMDIPQFGKIIYQKQMEKMENDIYQTIVKVGISVDKDKIVKALTNAREFYEEGYEQGQRDAVKHGRWEITEDEFYMGLTLLKCSICREEWCFEDVDDPKNMNYHYCPNCGAKMDLEETK